MKSILIGCDPELFLKDKESGEYFSAHGLIPGTKAEPHKVKNGAVQVDGMALEFNIDPASTAEEFLANVQSVMKQMKAMIPSNLEFALEPTATFTKAHFDLQPEEAKELGCEPDYNAYTLKENPRPDNTTTMRTASGHVHIGVDGVPKMGSHEHMIWCATLVKQMDLFLGVPSLLYDRDEKRRTMYGAPGAFRPKPYGCEYRVLSNRWLASPDLIKWVFNQTQYAVEMLLKHKKEMIADPDATMRAISPYMKTGYYNTKARMTSYLRDSVLYGAPGTAAEKNAIINNLPAEVQ